MRAISFINLKGGVGKTSVTVNSAYTLANFYGARVLVIDCDKQGNSTQFFGGTGSETTLTDILLDRAEIKDCIKATRYTPEWFIQRDKRLKQKVAFHTAKIDLIAADMSLKGVEYSVLTEQSRRQDNILTEALETIADDYDMCLLDNPPDNSLVVLNALAASDEVIPISSPDAYSVQGVFECLRFIKNDVLPLTPNLVIGGTLINQYVGDDSSLVNSLITLQGIVKVFPQRLRFTRRLVTRSIREGKSIYEISPRCGFAQDMYAFWNSYLGGKGDIERE